ncbi:hypothetical protein LTR84_010805 [Exophiala bonariae]|uniref:NADPH--cytochrome P450 reductase n=1 Tax=Exophiala bonariae TaxID=1690606 RepID=A0AAV9NII1_9EURO|nr:hypothetical protein LTR84_010805 [Exophiala bonariae]
MSLTLLEFGHSAAFLSPLRESIARIELDDLLVLTILLAVSIAYFGRGIIWDKPDPYHQKWFERPQADFIGLNVTKTTRNIAQKLAETGHQVIIFWGSQSGTAEGFANNLARECHLRLRLRALVADVSEYDHHTLTKLSESQYAIFIMSTYGEGDPSDNSTSFISWLQAGPQVRLTSLRFAAFGCGNSNYKHYNAVVDTTAAALENLGAEKILPTGKADEARGTTEEDFLEWKPKVLKELCSRLALTEYEPNYEPTISTIFDESIDFSGVYMGEPMSRMATKSISGPSSSIVALPISSARELINDRTVLRSCLHIELDLAEHPEVKYKTGDHLVVQPTNPLPEVQALVDILGLVGRENIPIMLQSTGSSHDKISLPSPTTIYALFGHYLEICAPVSRATVISLAQFASTSSAQKHLLAIASDKSAFSTFLARNHINFSRLLRYIQVIDPSATWSNLPLSFVIESIRPMTTRYYSISSSSITSPRRVAITVANNSQPLLEDDSVGIPGLASTYLSSFMSDSGSTSTALYPTVKNSAISTATTTLPPIGLVNASIRRSTFKLPASLSIPLIMIAAGTGIAPFRAFLQERARLASLQGQRTPLGRMVLIFGCRHPDQDLLYREELENIQSTLPMLEIVYAFSRLEGQNKVYVQDRVAERQDDLISMLLEDDAALYICGSATMAREVRSSLGEGVKRARLCDENGWNSWRKERRRAKRWQEDVWG